MNEQKKKIVRVPEWTPEEIIKVRQIYRKGGSINDVVEALQTPLHREAVRSRAISLGMRFIVVPRSHNGTSKMVQGYDL
jgi:hypothetical protein